jgi:hypothetical protein
MTIVIIIGAGIYSSLEDWSFDEAVNFCIVSFATIGKKGGRSLLQIADPCSNMCTH